MPCYNVASTLERALSSVLMQRMNDNYEIIIIDDASVDETPDIAKRYADEHSFIRYFRNTVNSGNAHSFYRGLSEARGEYFCVLDGDDYYSIANKLQKQIDFLDADDKFEYVAVATHFVIDFGNGNVHVPDRPTISEFTYIDLMLSKHAYLHTSTYMYRNVFRGNVPDYFDMKLYRGDTPRTLFHLMYSGKKVKILDFVGSVYSYTFNGIWSASNEREHFQYQIDFYEGHREFVRTNYERQFADRMVARNKRSLQSAGDAMHHYPFFTIEECLREARRIASIFAFKEKEYVLREIYASEYIDTLCATLGYVARINDPALIQRTANQNVICIFVSHLNPQGGGIFAEVKELANMYPDNDVYIFQLDEGGISQSAYEELTKSPHVHPLTYPEGEEHPFYWLSSKVRDLSPWRSYYYCSHRDVLSQAVMQGGVCENICLFSFDHGFVVGLNNPNLDTIAAKRPVDYALLRNHFPDKLIYLPAWSTGSSSAFDSSRRRLSTPSAGITTASGAARFYKVCGEAPYNYIDAVMELLDSGAVSKHYHFGPIPENVLCEIRSRLTSLGLAYDRFAHIPWSQDIPNDLLCNEVDLFIEPFPTVSYKLTLNVLSAGIPVAAWRSPKRMSVTDFVPLDSLFWRNIRELVDEVKDLSPERLQAMSRNAKDYFKAHHELSVVRDFVRSGRTMPIDDLSIPSFADNAISEIMDYLPLFGMQRVSIMGRFLEEKRQRAAKNRAQVEDRKHRERAARRCSWMRESRSFKIGYWSLLPYRSIKRKMRGSSLSAVDMLYTRTPEEFVAEYGAPESERRIEEIQKSMTFRVGRLLTCPARSLRRLFKRQLK